MVYFFVLFWFFREIKAILFWLYLWQLKDYHWARFSDHFQTAKGKQILINRLMLTKLILLIFSFSFLKVPTVALKTKFTEGIYFYVLLILTLIYFIETARGFQNFFQKKLKIPVFTKKIIFLFLFSIILISGFFYSLFYFQFAILTASLLLLDILLPIIISFVVLLFQPLAVFFRNQIIKKAKKKRENFSNLLVIGITGSYGKTSVKEFLAEILSKKFNVLKTKEHQNSEIGISNCILEDLKPENQIFVCEMGTYDKGGIKLLCDIAKPKIGILTGINEQHMATFGSQGDIARTKFGLIESLPEDGLAIFNADNELIISNLEFPLFKINVKNKKFYSIKERSINEKIGKIKENEKNGKLDLWAADIKTGKESVSFKVISKDGDISDFKINLLGIQNIASVLAAVLCARDLGMNLDEISEICQGLKPMPHQMELKKGKNGLNIIDATYSANPDGVIAHLEYLKTWNEKPFPRKIIIMPCLIELGSASKEVHRRIGRKIAEVCSFAVITAKERVNEIEEGAVEKGMRPENILFVDNPKKILEIIKTFTISGDIILLEGRVPGEIIKFLI